MFNINLSEQDVRTIAFVGYRYAWSDKLRHLEAGDNEMSEDEALHVAACFIADTEGDHSFFPMLAPDCALRTELMRFYMEVMKRVTKTNSLREMYDACMDTYDGYGSCMEAWFAIAEECYHRSIVPSEWEFKPGVFIRYGERSEEEVTPFEECARDASSFELLEFGNTLMRYRSKLEAAGKSY